MRDGPAEVVVEAVRHLCELASDDLAAAEAGVEALVREHGLPAVGDAVRTVLTEAAQRHNVAHA